MAGVGITRWAFASLKRLRLVQSGLSVIFYALLLLVLFCQKLVAQDAPSAHRLPNLTLLVPMRDGAQLPTDLYFPNGTSGRYPCVLVRHPLGKEIVFTHWVELTHQGYLVAVQSTRSCGDLTGKSLPYTSDGWGALSDGYDTIEWLAKSDFCDGKVATIGESASGITQLLLAPSRPPHLVCQYIEVAAPSLYQYAVWPGGQFRKEQVEGWLRVHRRAPEVSFWLKSQRQYSDFWKQFNAVAQADTIGAPQFHVGGWFDIFLQGTLDAFSAAHEPFYLQNKVSPHKLVIGPWAHRFRWQTNLGDFPPLASGSAPPFTMDQAFWLDCHFRRKKEQLDTIPSVQYYVMGPFDGSTSSGNVWRTSDSWPPEGAVYSHYYLNKEKKLLSEKGASEESPVELLFTPENPVPTIGGRNLFIPDGPKDLSPIEKRDDVLVFTSEPLTSDLEVTGRLAACFYLSNVGAERDLCIRICDVYPDGRSVLIAEGVSHISKEDVSSKHVEPMQSQAIQIQPIKIQPVLVDLWSTSIVFAKGHKIRCLVSGSNFPAYEASLSSNDMNLLEKGSSERLCFKIHMDPHHASYIALPVMKATKEPVCEKNAITAQ